MSRAKLLVFGYGNPGRGDDALGPLFVSEIEKLGLPDVECQTDMQLQVEHVLDMQERAIVLFVDADVSCASPFEFGEIQAVKDSSYTSHAMTPQALMHSFSIVLNREPPPVFLLRIRGEAFELGDELSSMARNHLAVSVKRIRQLCNHLSPDFWRKGPYSSFAP